MSMEERQETTPVDLPKAGSGPADRTDTRRTIGLVLLALVLVAIVGATIYGLVTHPPFTAVVRDISIIVLALVTGVIGLFLIVLIFQLQSLIALLRDEIKPILESANQTANTVRGTTTFVSNSVVTPMIQAASLAAGVGQTLRVLTTTGHRHKHSSQTPPDPQGEQLP